MRITLAMALKDLRLLWRDKAGAFFVFVFPLLIAIFFGVIFAQPSGGGTRSVTVLLVDADDSEGSRTFVQTLRDAEEIDVITALGEDEDAEPLTRERAQTLVRLGRYPAYLVLEPYFGQRRELLFAGPPPEVELGIDPARQADAAMLEGILMRHMSQGMQEAFTNPRHMQAQARLGLDSLELAGEHDDSLTEDERDSITRLLGALEDLAVAKEEDQQRGDVAETTAETGFAFEPVRVNRRDVSRQASGMPRSSYDITFSQGIAWALIGAAAAFGISLVTERTKGTLTRLRIAPISLTHVLLGKGAACLITTVTVAGVMLVIARLAFNVRPDSVPLLVLALTSSALCFVGIMMLLAVLGKTEAAAGGIGWAVLLLMSMVGGGMVPLMAMPAWMHPLSNISPVKWAIRAHEGAIWRGYSLTEMLLPCGVLLGVGLVAFFAGSLVFRRTVR